MSDTTIIPVYGTKNNIIRALKTQNLDKGISVIPPIQLILDGNIQFSCDTKKISQMSEDICFLQLSQHISKEEEELLLAAIKTSKAPIDIKKDNNIKNNKNNSSISEKELSEKEEEIFSDLEEEFETHSMGAASFGDMNRLEDTTIQLASIQDESVIITSQGRALNSMIPEGYSEAIIIYHSIIVNEDGEVEYCTDKDPEVIFKVVKFSIDPENNAAFMDDKGGFLITSDSRFTYSIENFAASTITILTVDVDKDYQKAQSWYVHHDQMDGCSSNITLDILNGCSDIFEELYKELDIDCVKPQDIVFNPINSMGVSFNDEITNKISEEFISDIYGEEDDEF